MKEILPKLFLWLKKAWSIIAIFSVVFGFYVYFHEKKPDVQFTIIGDANVFDIYKSVNDLEVFFLGKNIEKENLNLKIYSISVENTGEADILKNLYDDNLPWGFEVKNGDIVSAPRIARSSSQYLDSALNPKTVEKRVEFDKVIFEHEKYFVIEFLVLHKKSESPIIVPFGKIAGVDNFKVLVDSEQGRETVLNQLISGGLIMHLIRLFVYTFISILLLVTIVFIIDGIDKIKIKREEKEREKIFQDYLDKEPILNPEVVLFLKNLYIKSGLYGFKKINKRLKNQKFLIQELEKERDIDVWRNTLSPVTTHPVAAINNSYFTFDYYDRSLLRNLIKEKDGSKAIDPSLKAELNRAMPYFNNINRKEK